MTRKKQPNPKQVSNPSVKTVSAEKDPTMAALTAAMKRMDYVTDKICDLIPALAEMSAQGKTQEALDLLDRLEFD